MLKWFKGLRNAKKARSILFSSGENKKINDKLKFLIQDNYIEAA